MASWSAARTDGDRIRLARMLRKAHASALDTGVVPTAVRPMVSDSWQRSVAAGVDPSRPAARALDAHSTAQRLREHPVAPALGHVEELLAASMADSGYFAAFSDAEGVLLWSAGPAQALRHAVGPRFLPGFLCSEAAVGTNAIGTALVVDQPVEIFSAEHFNQLLHGWTCAAAPIHDPDTRELLGALDLSGEFTTGHAHTLALVEAVCRAAEGWMASARREADDQLRAHYQRRRGGGAAASGVIDARGRVLLADPPGWLGSRVEIDAGAEVWEQPDGTSVCAEPLDHGFLVWRTGRTAPRARKPRLTAAFLGREQATVNIDGRRIELRPRHSEIVALLALNRAGMTVRELALALYGNAARQTTVRVEIARLRPLLGSVLCSSPYRLEAQVSSDLTAVLRSVARGDRREARSRYVAPLLPGSVAPGVLIARSGLEQAIGLPRRR